MKNWWQQAFALKPLKQGLIGILGGSFNPPHQGHLHISNLILKQFGLNLLYWLVTPQNPFKENTNVLTLNHRLDLCKQLVSNCPQIKVSGLEEYLPSVFTYNTLEKLLSVINDNVNIIWFMGEDMLYSFHKFYRWQDICKLVNLVIISRGGNSTYLSLNQKFPTIMKDYQSSQITTNHTPNWVFTLLPRITISSTEIRKKYDRK